METPNELTIVFDTDCLMCSAWIGFILRHEREPSAQFISAWSQQGLTLAAKHGMTFQDLDETYLVVRNGQPLVKSDATFAILNTLNAPWCWVAGLRFMPKIFRDGFYDLMAKNRYRWFGKRDQCFLPPKGQQGRFILGPARSTAFPDHG